MTDIYVNSKQILGRIKPMHAVNNGPIKNGPGSDDNFEAFREAGIPFVRNHDASFCASYGGEHTVDILAVFPDFDKDPYDPASYDFVITDTFSGLMSLCITPSLCTYLTASQSATQ